MDSIYNNTKLTEQNVYNSFNSLMFTDDTRVFHKMTKKIELYLKTKDLVGDIVELGVFKGASMGLWLKLRNMYEPHSITKVIGFDFFDSAELMNNLSEINKITMTKVIKRVNADDLTMESVKANLDLIDKNYLLIKGDAAIKSKEFSERCPGHRIKILYMDLDLGEPTLKVLENLWKHVVIGGIIVFDEYAYHIWDESIGVDIFLKSIKEKYTFFKTDVLAPTMYLVKLSN